MMDNHSPVEKAGAVLGGLLLLGGVLATIWPKDLIMQTFGNGHNGGSASYTAQFVSKERSRIYGIASIAIGGTILALSIYRERR